MFFDNFNYSLAHTFYHVYHKYIKNVAYNMYFLKYKIDLVIILMATWRTSEILTVINVLKMF